MARSRAYKLKGSFGAFNGTKVYYLGFPKAPGILPKSGRGFAGLKHLLEQLEKRLKKFTLTFTLRQDSIVKVGKKYRVRISVPTIKRLTERTWTARRELSLRLASQLLGEAFPQNFSSQPMHSYQRGMFVDIFRNLDPRLLLQEDRATLTKFVTKQVTTSSATVDIPTAYSAARDVQMIYLKRLVAEFETRLNEGHDESWWQEYFSKNILYFQDNYIQRLPKINLTVVGTQFPDFPVITSDGYLDIIEIKKPGTELLKEDTSRHNFYWSSEVAKGISQVENYIDSVTKNADAIRNKLRDHGIDFRIIKPRGIVIAGKASDFVSKKMGDDFRCLNEGLKNVEIIPYDELSQHLKNTMVSISRLAKEQAEGIKSSAKRRKRSR